MAGVPSLHLRFLHHFYSPFCWHQWLPFPTCVPILALEFLLRSNLQQEVSLLYTNDGWRTISFEEKATSNQIMLAKGDGISIYLSDGNLTLFPHKGAALFLRPAYTCRTLACPCTAATAHHRGYACFFALWRYLHSQRWKFSFHVLHTTMHW